MPVTWTLQCLIYKFNKIYYIGFPQEKYDINRVVYPAKKKKKKILNSNFQNNYESSKIVAYKYMKSSKQLPLLSRHRI